MANMRPSLAALACVSVLNCLPACSTPAPSTPVPPGQTVLDNHSARSSGGAAPASDERGAASAEPDPSDPQTWIALLDDPDQLRNAVAQLQRMRSTPGIDAAIEPLARVWDREGRPKQILVVIAELAESGVGGPHWARALPVLRVALDEHDVGDSRSLENAILAADALGRSGDASVLPSLIRAAKKHMPRMSPGQRVRLSAIHALGRFPREPGAVATLIDVLAQDPKTQLAPILAATALALAESRSPDAVEPLLLTLFAVAPIYSQCRRALINIGKPALDRLLLVLQGKDPVLKAFARANQFNVECKRAVGPGTDCQAPGNLPYKSALLLGDFYSERAVAPLLAELSRPSVPAYFERPSMPGPSQHTAVLDALKRIGAPSAAARVWRYARARKTDDSIRPMAIDTYSFLDSGTGKLRALARLIKDDKEDEPVRLTAGVAYGRLARSTKDYGPLLYMIRRYRKVADKKLSEARKLATAGRGEEASMIEQTGRGYRGFQRAFEYDLARAHVGVTCQRDASCYARILDTSADDLAAQMAAHVRDWNQWSDEERDELHSAARERALLELRKLGSAAAQATDALLRHVDSENRVVREGILLALVKVAPLPCDRCVARLEQVIEAQKDRSTMQRLSVETQAVRGYFLWAGR